MAYLTVDVAYLRDALLGKITFRKCPCCDKEGIELQNYDGDGNPCTSNEEDAMRYPCDICEGLGYIENAQEH